MLDYAHQRALDLLRNPGNVVLATTGPAGIQASEFPCEAIGLDLYILVPKTSDHIFNLEHCRSVTLLTSNWELKGEAELISLPASYFELILLKEPEAEWCSLVRVHPSQIHIRREKGWGYCETIEL